ncbi:hypothetical protein QAD02_007213 [Eretmocerus hayati]|uniref:Uncharacterized protein n=1 Tax=Eretmocerus hayati TaxID=131215 RepID=A0ACC2N3W3_9HYME|nr:hypothetical protein QAD02_007213 [Eretmocerus hayati]
MEIDTRAGTFLALEISGQQLIQFNNYASAEIQEKLESPSEAKEELEETEIQRRLQRDQNLELQFSCNDCGQAENWMSIREALLPTCVPETESQDHVEALIKEHENSDKAIDGYEEESLQ